MLYCVYVLDSFGAFVADTTVDSWDKVESVYFKYRDAYPWHDVFVRMVSLHETTLGI